MATLLSEGTPLPKRLTKVSFERRRKLAALLRKAREDAKIDRATAARRAGVSVFTWSRWENAAASIPLELFANIRKALDPKDELQLVDNIRPLLAA